jgi:hypothetical protein
MTPHAYLIAAAGVLLLHLAFIVFVACGAALLWRWPRAAWLHLPAVAWGAFVELSGRICPLTPLENRLRELGGAPGYTQDFVSHYLLPVIYPAGLTREVQWALGIVVALLNAGLYAAWIRGRRRRAARP